MMFGFGCKRERVMIDSLQESLGEAMEREEALLNKCIRLEQSLIIRDEQIRKEHNESITRGTALNLLGVELKKYQNRVVELTEAMEKKIRPRRHNRKQLSRKTGFTKVTNTESLDMYEMYKQGTDVDRIAKDLDRSQSCVSRHIRKHLEEEDNGFKMADISGTENRTFKEEE